MLNSYSRFFMKFLVECARVVVNHVLYFFSGESRWFNINMHRYLKTLFCILLVLSIVDPIKSKRSSSGGRHSYPKHSGGGLSGGGHGYPSSGGSHGYPSSGGLSGGGHGYPSSGNSHGYPSSGGLSGTGGGHGYPSSGGSHGYPSSGTHGSSGQGHGYPSGHGLSGNTASRPGTGVSHTTNVHHHYNYNPPQQIRYTPTYGGPAVNYPVYRGNPPNYVYQYKDSGSKYGTLLAGLALLNLGTLGVATYAAAKAHGSGSGQSTYVTKPGEVCKFGLKKDNGDYEETRIDCNLISSFIYEEEAKHQTSGINATVVTTTTVTNVTTLNADGSVYSPPQAANPVYEMLPNGTLVPVNATNVNTTATNSPASPGPVTSSVTITTTNTTTTNALDVKGKSVEVTPGMQCYVLRHSPTSNMKRSVPCGLLQTYATQSLKKNSASRNLPVLSILSVVISVIVAY